MKLFYNSFLFTSILFSNFSWAQPAILDPCFTSGVVGTSFLSTANLGDVGANADLCSWTGATWTGGWPGANLTIVPPVNSVGCRAIWSGSGTVWTTGGEGFGVKIASGMVAGVTYTYNVVYVSHGTGSTGAFNPIVYTNSSAALAGAFLLGNMPAVGNTWTTKTLSFTAVAAQAGHTWIIFGTWPGLSSGFVNNFCGTCNVSVLPIELLHFDAKTQGENKVVTEWSTATELKNDYFILQRSKDGINFDDLSKINGAGNSNSAINYSSSDEHPLGGTSYYRLKSVATDGAISFSALRSVRFTEFPIGKLFPNPASGFINLPLQQSNLSLSEENSEIEIVNYLGQTILKTFYSPILDVSKLEPGYYYLKLSLQNTQSYNYKFVKE